MELIESRSIFSPATGFIRRGGFEWTCNPYVGCTFGCQYCYAMFLPQNRRPVQDWGRWFQAKRNAVELARKQSHKVAGQCVYLSSVTDPYQPAERGLMLTRGVLEAMVAHQPRLVVQTRGPIVVRDIDLLTQFRCVRVNLSIPTDSERVREQFEPKAPPLERRWEAFNEMRSAGVPVGLCVTPTLPIEDPDGFARVCLEIDQRRPIRVDNSREEGGFLQEASHAPIRTLGSAVGTDRTAVSQTSSPPRESRPSTQ